MEEVIYFRVSNNPREPLTWQLFLTLSGKATPKVGRHLAGKVRGGE